MLIMYVELGWTPIPVYTIHNNVGENGKYVGHTFYVLGSYIDAIKTIATNYIYKQQACRFTFASSCEFI